MLVGDCLDNCLVGEEIQYKLRAHGLGIEDAAELLFENFESSTSLVDMRAMLAE